MRTVVTLTLNPAVDLSAVVEGLAPERKLRCADVRRDPGGGGINVARVVRRLGGDALAVFAAGGPNGARLRGLLEAEGAPHLALPIDDETREDFTALDHASGEQYRFVMPGPRLTLAERRRVLEAVEALGDGVDILVASGSLPPGVPAGVYGRLARWARRSGVRLALDASGGALRRGLAAGVWLAKPNLRELEEYCGRSLPDEPSRLDACRTIIASGGARLIALSLGREGAILAGEAGAWRARALPIQPLSSVGAGDSFLAGLTWALAAGRAGDEALRWAVAAGSAALLEPGTQLCTGSAVRRLMRSVCVEAICEAD